MTTCGRCCLNNRHSPSKQNTFSWAFSRTEQVLTNNTSASAGLSVRVIPSEASSTSRILEESYSFIWQPKVFMYKRPGIGKVAKILGTMAIREVLKMGDPRLLAVSEPVRDFGTPELAALLADMRDTMRDLNGAGLAAPQIGIGLRVVIFGMEHNPRYPAAEPVPYTVLINPTLTPLSEDMDEAWEGCLSVPGMRGVVPRYRELRYVGVDP